MSTAILLLKTVSDPDLYTPAFPAPPYVPRHIPPLSTTTHLAAILAHLRAASPSSPGATFPYAGLLFTSTRAVTAFARALRSMELEPGVRVGWAGVRIPLFAVGRATAGGIRGEGIVGGEDEVEVEVDGDKVGVGGGGLMPRCWIEGEEAGSGDLLVQVVARRIAGGGRVLWLAGETRRDSVRLGLLAAGFGVEVCVAYGTVVSEGFQARLGDVLRETGREMGFGVRWVVVFSVQGAVELLRGLGWWDQGAGRVRREDGMRDTFVACIGSTTREALWTELGLPIDVCAERPCAEAVREGIERFMWERGLGGVEPRGKD